VDFSSADLHRLRSWGLVRGIEHHAEIDSTNVRAVEVSGREALECPYVVLASNQTAGRGRGANRWWSAPGALTFSLVIDARQLDLPGERWPQVALAAGLAVCHAIEPLISPAVVALKWPNDVFLSAKGCAAKKAGGILVEAPAASAGRLVIGIGLNVNNAFAAAPAELREVGTSMIDVAGRPLDRCAVLLSVLEQLGHWLPALAIGNQVLIEQWRRYCLLTGKRVRLQSGSRLVEGLCGGIDESGRLLLVTDRGMESFASGTVIGFK
jgi:BirA family transcriptional regulator, biotin operon repressor / biotin---[acetyl-CoA-carboxylase] ligase